MQYLHSDVDASAGDIVEVTLDHQANVRLLDSINFSRYQSGQQCQGYGGLAVESPVRLPVPHRGRWHVVIDLVGYTGRVRANVRVLRRATL